jgi:hypothetical protein
MKENKLKKYIMNIYIKKPLGHYQNTKSLWTSGKIYCVLGYEDSGINSLYVNLKFNMLW